MPLIERTGARHVLIDRLSDLQYAARDPVRLASSSTRSCNASPRGHQSDHDQRDPTSCTSPAWPSTASRTSSTTSILLQYLRADTRLLRTVTVLKSRASAHEPEIASSDITPGGILSSEIQSSATTSLARRRPPQSYLGRLQPPTLGGRTPRPRAGAWARRRQAQAEEPHLRCSRLKGRGGRPFEPGSAHRGKAASEAESQLRQHRADCFQCALRKRREALFMQAGAKARGTSSVRVPASCPSGLPEGGPRPSTEADIGWARPVAPSDARIHATPPASD